MRPASGDPILPFVSICRNWKTETSLKSSTTCFMKNIRVYVGCYSPHLGHLFDVWVPAALTVSPPKKVMNWSAGQFFETSGRRSRQLQLDSPDFSMENTSDPGFLWITWGRTTKLAVYISSHHSPLITSPLVSEAQSSREVNCCDRTSADGFSCAAHRRWCWSSKEITIVP